MNELQLPDIVKSKRNAIEKIAARHVDIDRFTSSALLTFSRRPELRDCEPWSLFRSMLVSAQLGLDCSGEMGEAYIVPFNQKNGPKQAQLIVGYRGYIKLARQSGEIRNIEARCVFQGDTLDVEYGLEPKFRHVPNFDGQHDETTMTHVYCLVNYTSGGFASEVMTKAQVEAVRKSSRSGKFGPWADKHTWLEMARKSVVRRLSKWLPLTIEASRAMAVDDMGERGETQSTPEVDAELAGHIASVSESPSRTDEVADMIDGEVVEGDEGGE